MKDDTRIDDIDELALLDRLVDDELTPDQRRQLLQRLENQPDGWRRCALAFLEAQAWRRSFKAVTASAAPKDPGPRPARSAWWSSALGTVLAAAACFLMALGVGIAWRAHSTGPDLAVVDQPTAPDLPIKRGGPAETTLAVDRPQWGTVTVPVDQDRDGELESLELPVVKGPGIDEQWVRNQPQAIPPHVLRALERMGHQVELQRQYYPFELGDGQRVVVPVDEFNLRYVGERHFQ